MIVVASDSLVITGGLEVVSASVLFSVGVLITSLSFGVVAMAVVSGDEMTEEEDETLVVEVAALVELELDLETPVVVESPGTVIALDREVGAVAGVVSLEVTLVGTLLLLVEEDRVDDKVGVVLVVELFDEVVEDVVEELVIGILVEVFVVLELVVLVLVLEELLEIVVEVVVVVVVVEEEVVSSTGAAFLTIAFIFSTKFPLELVLSQPAETSHIEIPPKYLLFKISLVKY